MSNYRVLIVENEPSVSRLLCDRIGQHPDFSVAGCVQNGREAVSALKSQLVDVVFTDLSPRLEGPLLVQHLREAHPNVRIVILSDYQSFSFAQAAIKHQVFEYMLKPVCAGQVGQVLDQIAGSMRASP